MTCANEAGIKDRDKSLYATVSVRFNHLSMYLIPASHTQVLTYPKYLLAADMTCVKEASIKDRDK